MIGEEIPSFAGMTIEKIIRGRHPELQAKGSVWFLQ
jgi:hypothetical protein